MYLTNSSLKIIKNLSQKGGRLIRHNNILSEEFHEAIKYFRNINNTQGDAFVRRKFINDTGFQKVDNLFVRKRMVSKLVDRNGKENKYAQKRIVSRYDNKGRLVTRQIDRQNELYLTTERSIETSYLPKSCSTVVTSNTNGVNMQKIIAKGKPTQIIQKEVLTNHPSGACEMITERHSCAHLNKSPLKYTEKIQYNLGTPHEPELKTTKKVVVFKDGLKVQRGTHNGSSLLVEIPPKGKGNVTIHKSPEDIKDFLSKFRNDIQEFLI